MPFGITIKRLMWLCMLITFAVGAMSMHYEGDVKIPMISQLFILMAMTTILFAGINIGQQMSSKKVSNEVTQ